MDSNRISRRGVAVCAALCLAATLAVCGSSGVAAASQASGVTYAKHQLAKYTPLVTKFTPPGPALSGLKAKLSGKVVWYIPIFLQAPIFTADSIDIAQPLALAGATVHVCDAGTNPSQANACLTQAVAAHAAGIVTDAMNYSFAPNGYAAAIAAHIPVVAAGNDNATGFPSTPDLTTVSAGYPTTSRLAADWIIANSGGKADILYAADNSNDGKIEAAATYSEIRQHCPGCKVHVVTFGDATVQNLAPAMSSAMVANPGIDYVYGGYDAPSGIYALQGVDQVQGRKFTYITGTGQPPGLERVANGTQSVDPGSDTDNSMWNTADALFRIIDGKAPVQHTPALRVFTKANLPSDPSNASAYASGAWYTNGGFKTMYAKLWGM
jgi:ribose transport system substrate-binding protein